MADHSRSKYTIHIEHGEQIAIGDGATLTQGITQQETTALLKAYRQRVLEETRHVQLLGIPLPRDQEGKRLHLHVPLDRVYIRIQALPETKKRQAMQAERQAVEEVSRGLDDALFMIQQLGEYLYRRGESYRAEARAKPVDPEEALREHKRLVILGAPGAGKTTLLRYLARRASEAEQASIPILVSLRNYAAYRGTGGTESLRAFALRESAHGDEHLYQALEQVAERGAILWLVDALDEAREWRAEAAREAAALPGQMVLTSRPVGYERAGLEALPHFEALALTPQARDKFLHDWFAVLAEARGEDEAWIRRRVAWLQAELKDRPRIQPLTRNPLLLTFLVILAGEEPSRELPTSRAELYRQYVEELLTTWEYQRRPKEGAEGRPVLSLGPLSGEQARQAAREGLLRLGWWLHLTYYGGRAETMPTRENLIPYLSPSLAERWELSQGEAETLAGAVLDFWEEAGLLVHWRLRGTDYLAFRHLTFQEYAAARMLAELWGKSPKRAWRFLHPRLHHPAWREILLLMAGLVEDATPLVQAIRKAHSPYERELHRDLFLAAEVAGEGRRVAEAERAQLVRRLGRAFRPRRQGMPWLSRHPTLQAYLRFPRRASELWLYGERRSAAAALGQLGEAAVKPLIQALGDKDEDVRQGAAKALGRLGEAAVEPLIQALRDGNWRVREAAAEALGQMGDARAVEPLIQALGDEDGRVREAAAEALGQMGDARAVEPLIQALGDEERWVREAAALGLGRLGDARAVEPLIQALRDGNRRVREAAAEALGQLGDGRAVEPLIQALGDEETLVRWVAAEALGQLGKAAVEPLIQALGDGNWRVRQAAAEALGQLGEAAVEPLIHALRDGNWRVRQGAAEALGQLGEAAVEPLIQALRHGDWRVREAAAEALGQLGDARAVEPLIQALGDEASLVRWAAALALGRLGDGRAVEPLIQALGDKEEDVRWAAAKALGQLGEAVVEPLIQALRDGNWRVRQGAAEALGQLAEALPPRPARRAIRALWWRLTDLEAVAGAAATALRPLVAQRTEGKIAALPFSDPLTPQQRADWQVEALSAGGLILSGLLDLTTNLATTRISEQLGAQLPWGVVGWVVLLVAFLVGSWAVKKLLAERRRPPS